jgi:hypothetical protein
MSKPGAVPVVQVTRAIQGCRDMDFMVTAKVHDLVSESGEIRSDYELDISMG